MTSAIVDAIFKILGFVYGKVFPKKTQAQEDNGAAQTEADIARQTEHDSENEQSKISSDTANADRRVKSDGLRSGASEISDEIDRTNRDLPKR